MHMIQSGRHSGPPPPTWRLASGAVREPAPPLLQFTTSAFEHASEQWRVHARYVVQDGPTFVSKVNLSRWQLLPSEWNRADFTAKRQAYLDILGQVRAYNAAILPIDNGPEALVYLAETCHRLREAVAARTTMPRQHTEEEPPEITELIAACLANDYAGDLAVQFIRTTTPPPKGN